MSLPANCPAKNPASAGPTAPGSSEPSPPALAGDSSACAAGAGVKRRQSDRRRPHLDSALSKSSAAIPEQRIPVVSASSIMRSLSSKVSPQPKQPTLRRSVSWHPNVVDHASDLAPRGPTLSRSQRSLESLAPSPPVAPDQTTTRSKPRRSRASADTFTPSRPGASTTAHLSSHQLLYPSPPHSPPIAATTSLSTTPPSSTNPAKTRRARKPRSEGASKPKAKSKRRHADSRGDFPTAHLSEALGIYTTVQDSPHHLPNSRPQPHSARPLQRELGSTFPSSSLHSLTESTPASSTIPTTPSSTIHMPKIRRRPSHQRNADPHPTTPNRNLAILWQVDHIHETTSPYAWPLELFSPHKYSRNASMAPVPATVETKAPKMDTKVGCDSNETDEVVACVPTSPVVKCGCMLRIMADGGRAGGKKKNAK